MKKLLFVLLSVVLAGVVSAQNDRATFGLKGDVKKVIQSENPIPIGAFWENYDLEFSQSGALTKIGGKEIKKEVDDNGVSYFVDLSNEEYFLDLYFNRTPQNKISTSSFDDGGSIGWDTLIYNSKGRVDKIKTYAYIEAGYNEETDKMEEGKVVEVNYVTYYYDENDNVIKLVQYDIESKRTITVYYKYQSFDQMGNWLVRVVNCETLEIKNQVEKRTIGY